MPTIDLTPARAITLLLLLPLGACESECDNWNTGAFFQTATRESVERCLAAGADANAEIAEGWTPLHYAAYDAESPGAVAVLVDAGADANAVSDSGSTPLHLVAAREDGSPAHIAPLVAAGAAPNAADEHGRTPLHYAATYAPPDLIHALIAAGAHPDPADDGGRTPLHYAAMYADSPSAIVALTDAGADPNATAADGFTPLHLSVYREDSAPDLVAALVAAGANPNAADGNERTPLHYAATRANGPFAIHALIAAGSDANAGDDKERTPFHYAANHNSAPVLRAFADAGADPHRRDVYGWSPLPWAIMRNEAPTAAGEVLRLHLPEGSLTEEGRWRSKGLHRTACWFEQDGTGPARECYYFAVHENGDDESSRLVAFPVVRFRASGTQPPTNPVLHLGGGGPANPVGLEADPQHVWQRYGVLVAGTARDLYVIDPRGVGMSYPRLHCANVLDAARERLSPDPDGESDTQQAHAACKERLDRDGHDLSHYNSAAVARDIEALRGALGVAQWVLLGNSYGARYALTIARDFPGSVEALLLNGAAFPGAPPHPETWASDLEQAIERAFDHCGRSGACDPKSLSARFWKLVDQLEETPLTLTGLAVLSDHSVERMELTGSRLLRVAFIALYDDEFFDVFPLLVEQLERGGTTALEQALDTWLGLEFDESDSDPVSRAHYCAEEYPFVDLDAASRDARAANTHIRRRAELALEWNGELCDIWDIEPAAAIEDQPVRTAIPTLFLQGALDPTTPIHLMEERLGHFANHHVLVFDDSSHWGSVYGDCAMQAAAHFVRHKRIEESHRQCREP